MSQVKIQNVKIPFRKYDRLASARALVTIMKIFGMWHWQDLEHQTWLTKLVHHVHGLSIHVTVSLLFCCLMWIEAFKAPDIVEAGNVLYMALTLGVIIPKLISFKFRATRLRRFIRDLENNPLYELQSDEEVDMWLNHQRFFRNVVILFMSGSFFSGAAAFVGVLFNEDYQLGFPYWVPFEWRNPQRYWYAYGYNVMGIYVGVFSNVSYDMFGCYMLFHIGLLYKLLNLRFKQLRNTGEKDAADKLRNLLQLHSNIKRATKECEFLVSHYVLSQIIFSALIICFCGYRLQQMNIAENLGKFFAVLQFLSVMVLEIFLPCYFANEVTVNSSLLLFDIYNSDWLEYSVSTRKFINLYMEFLKHPVIFRAGGYFEIGLPIFTKVMNNAYSFFAVLLNAGK